MVPQGGVGVGGMNAFELQTQADHADIFLIFYSIHRFRVHVRGALLRYYQVLMIYSRRNIRKRYVGITPQIVRSIQPVLNREYSVRRGMVRSIQHLRQIVRVFIKKYGYTHFLNFQWANVT